MIKRDHLLLDKKAEICLVLHQPRVPMDLERNLTHFQLDFPNSFITHFLLLSLPILGKEIKKHFKFAISFLLSFWTTLHLSFKA